MRITFFQHVAFEDPGHILVWAQERNHEVRVIHLYRSEVIPSISSLDMLVVMGGPMGVYDDAAFPFLSEEKALIAACIKQRKKILGICLGAQLIACAAGAAVYKNKQREIGWFPLVKESAGMNSPLFSAFANKEIVFHWHGDTYDLPTRATHLVSSMATSHQAFILDSCALGLQFHIETTPQSLAALIQNCKHELTADTYVQSEKRIIAEAALHYNKMHTLLYALLDAFTERSFI